MAELQTSPATAQLQLRDGTVFEGESFGAVRPVSGEVVFNTGMVGYVQAITDPSYKAQILVLTFPLMGNYGVPDEKEVDMHGIPKLFESEKPQIAALICADYQEENHSHYKSMQSLGQWLRSHDVPALFGVDTRELTKYLRERGSTAGRVVPALCEQTVPEFADPNLRNLVAEVSPSEVRTYGTGKYKVLAVHCGMKYSIMQELLKYDITLKVVPFDYDFSNEEYDGLFLSNGPGDPQQLQDTLVQQVKKALDKDTPIFGICLGHQVLACAAGASTYKMKHANRSCNQPVLCLATRRCYITSQNHGYAVDAATLPSGEWVESFVNKNDNSNEGIQHCTKPFFSVQFHPEAMPGPTDAAFLFERFFSYMAHRRPRIEMAKHVPVVRAHKVLILGSGALTIGQAGEFDYSGSQAIKALKEQNIECVLINPNIATVQTSQELADKVYFLPVTPSEVERVIEKERPDGIFLQFGGQTALNCGIQLHDSGILAKYKVRVLGTPIDTIRMTEDRDLFAKHLAAIGERTAPSDVAESVEQAVKVASELGYPVLVRSAFTLGGAGSGFANNEAELIDLATKALVVAPQIILDKSLRGWKEVEYEVVRDQADNCITVCNMENFDPLGIHTGDSIVVAPSQTLSNSDYFRLRRTAIKVVRSLGVVGECNIQYALDPHSEDYCIIEVNARLSRSSALASKATGYPLAFVAAQLALGAELPDLENSVTKRTTACFEPALDYCVVKFPVWNLRKFSGVTTKIGSAMMSVGEVMAIGRNFEEAFGKAVRMVTADGVDGFGTDIPSEFAMSREVVLGKEEGLPEEQLESLIAQPCDKRVFYLGVALRRGWTVERLHELSRIDLWFLRKLQNVVMREMDLESLELSQLSRELMLRCKRSGMSDRQIARCLNYGHNEVTPEQVRQKRQSLGVRPFVKRIDTVAAEFPAETAYLYMTYHGCAHDVDFSSMGGVMVLGCGAYRIGQSCEFDWCAVSCNRELRRMGKRAIVVNYNPETCSTDFDEVGDNGRLYFEELGEERVRDIYDVENSQGVIVSVGGQVANCVAMALDAAGVRILGTSAGSIDRAEDRRQFSAMCDMLKIDQPQWKEATSMKDAQAFAQSIGYPVLVRPSYVLSGAAMNVATCDSDLQKYLATALGMHGTTDVDKEHPIVVSKFITGAKEIEFDAVARDGEILNYAISEHVENAGVHSGDATLVLPAQKIYVETLKRVKRVCRKIARELKITGPFNVQLMSRDNEIKVIECNLRASRSFPFVSKTLNANFIALATRAMVLPKETPVVPHKIDLDERDFVCVKAPAFSFGRLRGADPALRVEMASTGEVACMGDNKHEAFLKAILSTGVKLPAPHTGATLLVTLSSLAVAEFLPAAQTLVSLGYKLVGTRGTASFLRRHHVPCGMVRKPMSAGVSKEDDPSSSETEDASIDQAQEEIPDVVPLLKSGAIDLVINVPESLTRRSVTNGFMIRRAAIDFGVPLLCNIKLGLLFADAMQYVHRCGGMQRALPVKSWREYLLSVPEN